MLFCDFATGYINQCKKKKSSRYVNLDRILCWYKIQLYSIFQSKFVFDQTIKTRENETKLRKKTIENKTKNNQSKLKKTYETNKQTLIQTPRRKKQQHQMSMEKKNYFEKKKDKFFILSICFAGIVTESGQQHF